MNRIEQIKERLNQFHTAPREGADKGLPFDTIKTIGNFSDNAPADIQYLLAKLELAEKALKRIEDHWEAGITVKTYARDGLKAICED